MVQVLIVIEKAPCILPQVRNHITVPEGVDLFVIFVEVLGTLVAELKCDVRIMPKKLQVMDSAKSTVVRAGFERGDRNLDHSDCILVEIEHPRSKIESPRLTFRSASFRVEVQ